MTLTYRFRVRDKHAKELNRQGRAVNFVWNFCNETQRHAVKSGRKWLSGFDLHYLTSGTSRELGLHSATINLVGRQYAQSCKRHKRPWLRFRGRKSLGWIPVKDGTVLFKDGAFYFLGQRYDVWLSRIPPASRFGIGSFSQDALGRWYLNLPVEIEAIAVANNASVGIDLGLKDLAALSNGEKIKMPGFYRKSEATLAKAQRSRKSKRARSIHAKIANRRRDFLHKAGTRIARAFATIFVGDVSPSKIAKSRFAKSVLDAGWADFKRMLSYKAIRHGGRMVEVSEAYTSQVCSDCGAMPDSRPRGIADIGIRQWSCSECGAVHDRDVNAARNIARLGFQALAEGAVA